MAVDKKFEIKKILLVGVVPGIVAIIVAWINLKPNSSSAKTEFKTSVDSGVINNSGRDINQAGGDIIKADRDVIINNYGDTLKPQKDTPIVSTPKKVSNQPKAGSNNKSGDTYNVTSNNQQGGITAGKVDINNPIIIGKEEDLIAEETNYTISVDTVNKIVAVKPIRGSWNNVFVAIPKDEMDIVEPEFISQTGVMINRTVTEFDGKNEQLYGLSTNGIAATNGFYYGIRYKQLPSRLFFGDNGKIIHEYKLK